MKITKTSKHDCVGLRLRENTSLDLEGSALFLELSSLLEKLQENSLIKQYHVKVSTPSSLQGFHELDLEKKKKILSYLKNLNAILVVSNHETPARALSNHPESHLIKTALDFYGYQVDDQFWRELKSDQIVELYNNENIQIFRTFNFFNTCGYSLLELLSREWYELWERPSSILQSLLEYSTGILNGDYGGFSRMDVVPHLIKEFHNEEGVENFEYRNIIVKFDFISAVKSLERNESGFLVTCIACLASIKQKSNDNLRLI